METFHFEIYSGRGLEMSADATMAVVVTPLGEVGILPRHCDYVTTLATGVAAFTLASGEVRRAVISGGFAKFSYTEERLTILADTIDYPETVQGRTSKDEQVALEKEIGAMSDLDPRWEVASTKLARLRAIDVLQKAV